MDVTDFSSGYIAATLYAVEDRGEKVEVAPDDFDRLAAKVDRTAEPLFMKLKKTMYPVYPYDGIPTGLISLPDHAQEELRGLPSVETLLIPKGQTKAGRLMFAPPTA